jgi:metallopeptidase MepB
LLVRRALNSVDKRSCTALAQDLFQPVFAKDLGSRDTWDRYRSGILEYGGSQEDVLMMLEEFFGRPSNLDALAEGFATADAS